MDPQKTMTFGSAPQTIISFQLVSAIEGCKKSHPKNTAQSFPIEMQKLMRRMPFPRLAVGLTSANILVVTATVNPNEKPQRKRSTTISSSESARQKTALTHICSTAPQVMSRLRPWRSARKPLVSDPRSMPAQKMLARSSRVAGVAWGKRPRMMGFRKELRTSSTPSFMSTRHSSRKVRRWKTPRPTRPFISSSKAINPIICYTPIPYYPNAYHINSAILMNLLVSNLSNDLAKNNSVYLPGQLARNTTNVIHVSINGRFLKCAFLQELDRGAIAMSKNLREYLGTDVGKSLRVDPVTPEFEEKQGLSFLVLELNQVTPQLKAKVKIEDSTILEEVRKKERSSFFNLGELKYIPIGNIVYSVRVIKCLGIETGDKKNPPQSNFGKLLPDTQMDLRVPQGSLIVLQKTQSNAATIFRPDFKIEDMGIGGLDEQLFNIFRRAFASRRYSTTEVKRFGVKHVKGILLYGPPGTGKTLIARQLAKALNVKDLKIVNGPQIFSKFVGESQQNIRKLFAEARQDEQKLGDKSPLHIIVFDEIDAICKQRGMHGGVGAQVSDQVVNQLLTNIDGVEALNNIIVIGMTNRKDLLDQAILRPGRFEVHIEVHLPNQAGREQILRIHTKDLQKNNLLEKVSIEKLAELTKNFTGAEIEALVKSANSHAISRQTNILDFGKELIIDEKNLRVSMDDFLKALEEVRPQFGVDEEKFSSYFREKVVNYGSVFNRIMEGLENTCYIQKGSKNPKRSVLLHGKPGTGKTLLAVNFCRKANFSYLKIISPENMVGLTEGEKIRIMTKIFDDAYRTTSACILIDDIERLIEFSPIGRRFNNSVLQALLLLIERSPPKEECRLLILGTTSAHRYMDLLELSGRFSFEIEVPLLGEREIAEVLKNKFDASEQLARSVGRIVVSATIKQLLELADLVEDKTKVEEWDVIWHTLITAELETEIEQLQIE